MNLKELQHKIIENKTRGIIRCSTKYEDIEEVCHCQLNATEEFSVWTISSWYTKKGYGNQGIGRASVCNCPIAVQKTQTGDDWDSHIYTLNKNKVLDYFKVRR